MTPELKQQIETAYDFPPLEPARTRSALEADHAFLLKGDVFTPDVIEAQISQRRMR